MSNTQLRKSGFSVGQDRSAAKVDVLRQPAENEAGESLCIELSADGTAQSWEFPEGHPAVSISIRAEGGPAYYKLSRPAITNLGDDPPPDEADYELEEPDVQPEDILHYIGAGERLEFSIEGYTKLWVTEVPGESSIVYATLLM